MKNAIIAVTCIVVWGTGCAPPALQIKGDLVATVKKKAAFELGCTEEELKVTELSTGMSERGAYTALSQKSYGVDGCGKKASYNAYCTNSMGSENCDAMQSSQVTPSK